MDSTKKIEIHLAIKKVRNIDDEGDENTLRILTDVEDLLDVLSFERDSADLRDLLQLLDAYKQCNEVMADAFIIVNRLDLFNKKMSDNDMVDKIINQIINSL
jgi:hypothetical protein